MRLQPERPPDAADHRVTDASRFGHGPGAPVRIAGRRRLERLHDGLDLLIGDRAGRSTNWPRHFATVVFVVRRRRATAVSPASIHANTIRARNASARFTRGALRQSHEGRALVAVTTTSARGRPIFGMPLLDHKSGVSPGNFVSRGLRSHLINGHRLTPLGDVLDRFTLGDWPGSNHYFARSRSAATGDGTSAVTHGRNARKLPSASGFRYGD